MHTLMVTNSPLFGLKIVQQEGNPAWDWKLSQIPKAHEFMDLGGGPKVFSVEIPQLPRNQIGEEGYQTDLKFL